MCRLAKVVCCISVVYVLHGVKGNRYLGTGITGKTVSSQMSRRAVGAHGCEKIGAEISVTPVREDDDDHSTGQLPGKAKSARHGRSAGHAAENAFVTCQVAGGLKGGVVIDDNLAVKCGLVVDGRHNGLFHVFKSLDPVPEYRLYADDLHLRVYFAEVA